MSQKKAQLFNPLNGNINVTGVVTAASFVGSGSGLTGVASTDNIQTATDATFLANVNVTGVTTASGGFKGDLTGDVTGDVSSTFITGVAATFTGNVSIGGTLTYQDVSNVDSVGLITARKGIQVLADGINITGVTTVGTALSLADNVKAQFENDGYLQIYHVGSTSRIDNAVGSIVIKNNANDSDIQLSTDDGSGGVTTYILCDWSAGEVDLYYYGSRKLNTTTTGVTVTGTLAATAVTSDDYTGNLELDVFLFG